MELREGCLERSEVTAEHLRSRFAGQIAKSNGGDRVQEVKPWVKTLALFYGLYKRVCGQALNGGDFL